VSTGSSLISSNSSSTSSSNSSSTSSSTSICSTAPVLVALGVGLVINFRIMAIDFEFIFIKFISIVIKRLINREVWL